MNFICSENRRLQEVKLLSYELYSAAWSSTQDILVKREYCSWNWSTNRLPSYEPSTYCWHTLELHWKMTWHLWPFLGILAFAPTLAEISYGLQVHYLDFFWVIVSEWCVSSQGLNNCVNYLAEKLQHVKTFTAYVPHRLLKVSIMLLSFHIFLILTCGQGLFLVLFPPFKQGPAVLSCFTEVSHRQRLQKLLLVGIEWQYIPSLLQKMRVGLDRGCCSASQNPGPQFAA